MPITIVTEPKAGAITDEASSPIRISEVISALSFALDLTEGQPMGHSVRSCVFGMHIAKEIGLPLELQSDLYYALLMKDAGCSGNSSRMFQILGSDDIKAKRDVKTTDWTRLSWESLQFALAHVRTHAPFIERVRALCDVAINNKRNANEMVRIRCERGSAIARRIGLSENTAAAIHSLDELWNGKGHPAGLRGEEIPQLSRIMNLAQSLDVFCTAYGAAEALEMAAERNGRWFDPDLVKAFRSAAGRPSMWDDAGNAAARVVALEPSERFFGTTSETTLDNICLAFADVIDAKSPFTYRHSLGVADTAVAIARTLSLSDTQVTLIRRAALLHDIGKLSVSNTILDKPDKLTGDEWEVVREHPAYSLKILRRIPGFHHLSEIAGSHHEKLDGSGYFRNKTAEQLSLPARILVVSDIYDALAAQRPYRDALPFEEVMAVMRKDAPRAIDATCFGALMACSDSTGRPSCETNNFPAAIKVNNPTHKNVASGFVKPNGTPNALTGIHGTRTSDGDA
jgi:putative nucleotidyltransferase with HDIG domain